MFKYFLILFYSLLSIHAISYAHDSNVMLQNVTLKGKVTDESTKQALQGASVYFPELKKGVTTNDQGVYQINLPTGNYMVEVSYVGYSVVTTNIAITMNTEKNFTLNHAVIENANATVTSFIRATSSKKTPTPINVIRKDDLFKSASTNFIDALSKTPGVTQLSTGPAISKPVIRGLGYNRVVVLMME